jgi:hypothetical protein
MEREAVTVAQAAAIIGVSQDAIRKRVKRGSLEFMHDEQGRVLVYLPSLQGQDTQDRQKQATHKTQQTVQDKQDKAPALIRCQQCIQLMVERAALTAQNEALKAQIIAIQADREAWQEQASKAHEQAQGALQALNNQQSLALPGAVKEMGKLTDGTTPRGLWARLRDVIKPHKE